MSSASGGAIANVRSEEVEYRIESENLLSSLKIFAFQSNLQLLVPQDGLPEKEFISVQGKMSVIEALELILDGLGLDFSFGKNRALAIYFPADNKNKHIQENTSEPKDETISPVQEEIFVTGIRQSLRNNLQIKRIAISQEDVTHSETIGKFPDRNVADALQRMPGVWVSRLWGEGRDVGIRGTSKDVNRTLVNGQHIASTYWWVVDKPGRGFNYALVPSRLIDSIHLYKSSSAHMDEGSLGGTINMKTYSPLNAPNKKLQFFLDNEYSSLSDKTNLQIASLGNWVNNDETFGIFGVISIEERNIRRDGLETIYDGETIDFNDSDGTTHSNVYVPASIMGSAIFQQERKRNSGNLVLQWRPTKNIDVTLNAIASDMDTSNTNHNLLIHTWAHFFDSDPPQTFTNTIVDDNTQGQATLYAGESLNQDTLGASLDVLIRDTFNRTQLIDLKIVAGNDDVNITAQVGDTRANGGTSHEYLLNYYVNSRVFYNFHGGKFDIGLLDFSPTNAEDFGDINSLLDTTSDVIDQERYFQLDLEYEPDFSYLSLIKGGIKFRDHLTQRESYRYYAQENEQSSGELSLSTLSNSTTPILHQELGSDNTLRQYSMVNRDIALRNISASEVFSNAEYQIEFDQFMKIDENINSAYITTQWNSNYFEADLGVRLSETKQNSSGYQQQQLSTHKRKYYSLLPSINTVTHLHNQLLFRASAARVMARPNYHQITPTKTISEETRYISEGNPDLKPNYANQFDAGLEWYFQDDAIIALNYFQKNISSFVYHKITTRNIDGTDYLVSSPYNGQSIVLRGVEVQWSQFLGKNIGITSNYTYTDVDNVNISDVGKSYLPGNSKNQFNSSVFFESNRLTTRLSYNYRSESFMELSEESQHMSEAYAQWDFDISWTFNKNVNIYLEGVNILNETVRIKTVSGIPRGLYENGNRYVFGTQISF